MLLHVFSYAELKTETCLDLYTIEIVELLNEGCLPYQIWYLSFFKICC